jgi:hypothetical protein
MKVFRILTNALMLALIAALTTLGSGCEYARKVIVKDKVNQGAIAYNQSRIREAQEFFISATETEPNYTTAWLYLGATLYKDYQKEIDEAKKKEIAKHALDVYKKALSLAGENCINIDNAQSYIAAIYQDMNNNDEYIRAMEERAAHKCAKNEVKSQSYFSIATKYWQLSYDQTTRYQDKALFLKGDSFHYRNMDYPDALSDKQRTLENIAKGFTYIEKTLEIDPENVEAMFYKGMLIREQEKMTKDASKHKELDQAAVKIAADANDLQKKKQAIAAEKKAQEQAAPKS